ncbi:hypothetical protein P153DRAFT_321511, partial [Dothidotthia symphoricarpi CBS 119687]
MPVPSEPIERVRCTYKDCNMHFSTEKAMRSHKKHSDEHDYCHKCDEDFDSYDEFAHHKITRPDMHNKACRVCGDEFKSESGLKRHIELNHKVDQKLTCIGCRQSFYRACLFIEHLEFGHCDVIRAADFQGHIVHKHLITELLKTGTAYDRFKQKTAQYDAAQDDEEDGGINLDDDPLMADEEIGEVRYEALKPETPPETPTTPQYMGPYPPLPSQVGKTSGTYSDITATMSGMSLNGGSESTTVVGSPVASPFHGGSNHGSSTAASTSRQLKVWGSREGKSSSSTLFPNAKPNPAPSVSEFSIAAHDDQMEKSHGINIMRTRFWDPMSDDWNPERFWDPVVNKYYCPFVCEQTFPSPADMNKHIMNDHRITRMKCPMCLKYFRSATALMSHCESRGARCQINKADDYNMFLDRLSGGFLGVDEKTRPDHLNNPVSLIQNPDTGRMEKYKPPTATYLQYEVTTPPDWKEPIKYAAQIGGFPL